jgi:short subunit dehydrogenase-like uncharacterized protein
MGAKYDICVFGATGFTGKRVAAELGNYLLASSTYAIAGRSLAKLEEILPSLSNNPAIILADVYDKDSMVAMLKSCRVVIDCVGPYRYVCSKHVHVTV